MTPDDLIDPQDLTTKQFCWLLGQIAIIRAWTRAVEAEALIRLLNGEELPGWKAVEGRPGNRKWDQSEAIIVNRLRKLNLAYEDVLPRVLVSPAVVEKLLKSERRGKDMGKITDLIIRPRGKPAIVPDSDPRSPYVKGSEFETHETDEEDY